MRFLRIVFAIVRVNGRSRGSHFEEVVKLNHFDWFYPKLSLKFEIVHFFFEDTPLYALCTN